MKNVIRTSWRDAATLIVLSKKAATAARQGVNYEILFQTRTASASFANGIVFPGGVTEPSDASDEWLNLFRTFGYGQGHFDAFHRAGAPITPILGDNPVKRHIALRITAIRETFEELGLLLCRREHQKDRRGLTASTVSVLDVKHWQSKVSKNPEELLNLCKDLGCYPDIWSLYYWSNWLTPTHLPKRFDTAFFITALEHRPENLESSSEVAKFKWSSPEDTLEKCRKQQIVLFPPQSYELNRLTLVPDREELVRFASGRSARGSALLYPVVVQAKDGELHLLPGNQNLEDLVLFPPHSYELNRLTLVPDREELVRFASARSARGSALLYPVVVQAKDGELHLLPGDELYPSTVDYYTNDAQIIQKGKTVLEARAGCRRLHRFERSSDSKQFVIKNCVLDNHIDMGDRVIPVA